MRITEALIKKTMKKVSTKKVEYRLKDMTNGMKIIFNEPFEEIEEKIQSSVRPLICSEASAPPVWIESQWESTSSLPSKLTDEHERLLSSHAEKLRQSIAFVTVNKSNTRSVIRLKIPCFVCI